MPQAAGLHFGVVSGELLPPLVVLWQHRHHDMSSFLTLARSHRCPLPA